MGYLIIKNENQILPNTNYFKYKTKVDEIRETIDTFGKEYLNEWKDDNLNRHFEPFNITKEVDTSAISELKKYFDLWLDGIREPVSGETPVHIGLTGSIIYSKNIIDQFNNIASDFSNKCGDQTGHSIIDNHFDGAFVGTRNGLYGAMNTPSGLFDNMIDFDYANLYPKFVYLGMRHIKHIPKRKVRSREQFMMFINRAIFSFYDLHPLRIGNPISTGKYKYMKRMSNKMLLSYNQYKVGRRKLKLPRRKNNK